MILPPWLWFHYGEKKVFHLNSNQRLWSYRDFLALPIELLIEVQDLTKCSMRLVSAIFPVKTTCENLVQVSHPVQLCGVKTQYRFVERISEYRINDFMLSKSKVSNKLYYQDTTDNTALVYTKKQQQNLSKLRRKSDNHSIEVIRIDILTSRVLLMAEKATTLM